MSVKIPVAILGATGSVGQKFITLLADHPWFEITALAASDRSAGKPYHQAANWFLPNPIPAKVRDMVVQPCEPGLEAKLAFSGLDSSVAGTAELAFAKAGFTVVSNAKNHRMGTNIPLVIPEVNSDHIDLVKSQEFENGMIITNPNCSVIGLVMALKPLYDAFGLEAVNAVTMQALSGAGYPGVSSLDIIDNVVPYIADEEDKVEEEPQKLLGNLAGDHIESADFKVSAFCHRVAVTDGHLEAVSVKLARPAAEADLIAAWQEFRGANPVPELPSAPEQPIQYFDNPYYPQPRLHRNLGYGMTTSVGRLRECPLLDYKFSVLSHNTVRGAAGCAILNAELAVAKGLLKS